MKKLFAIALFSLLMIQLKAQNNEKVLNSYDIALAGGSSGFSPALGISKTYGFGRSNQFKVGFGLRYTGFFSGKETFARTAPAKLTSGKNALAALFSEDIVSQIDTFNLQKIQTNAVNLNIHLGYAITSKLDVGFNIDALGFTFGGKQTGGFVAKTSDATGLSNNGKSFSATPTAFNLLLISDSDIGSLNSELFVRYWVTPKIGIRAGASFQFVEYKSEKKLAFDNDRFRSKQLLPLLALTVKL